MQGSPAHSGSSDGRVTPAEIIQLILEEMEAGMFPSFYSNLVPSLFSVYLRGEDLERLRPLESRMRDEAVRALAARLSALNKTGRLKIPLMGERGPRKKFEAIGEWSVEFHENTDDDAKDNPLVVVSNFPSAAAVDDRVGTMTERVTRRSSSGQTTTTATQRASDAETRRVTSGTLAHIEYEDHTGAHTFAMTKDVIKAGRGSIDRWVDLKLSSQKDLSREHLQIRRDPATGTFFLKDLSTLGTTVNDRRVPASIERVDGQEVDRNLEVPLPDKAKIVLAGVLTLQFRAVR